MMELFRKHKKAIYWLIIALVGVPFIFIGTGFMPFSNKGGGGLLSGQPAPVATVGGLPIQEDELREALSRQSQTLPGQDRPDYAALLQSGKVDETINNLVKSRLVEREASEVKLAFDRQYLEESLKKDPSFQNEQGQFDPENWNTWVREMRESNTDWNTIYASIQGGIDRRIMGQRVAASARVRQEELREQFERDNSKFTLKYLAIEPKVEPTDEQIGAHYEAHKADYDIPAQRKAEFIAVSTAAPRPAELDSFVAQAREGKDFETIAKSAPANLNAQGRPAATWISEDKVSPDLALLFTLQAGDVSEPIKTPAGYVICKVEEARISPETAKREIRASMMSIAPQLTDEERAAQDAKIAAIAGPAQSGDLAAAATQAGLIVQTTDLFSTQSTAILNVPAEDTAVFAQGLEKLEQGKAGEAIRGRENAYIAKVIEVVAAVPQPLEAVRDRVVTDTVAELKQGPGYKEKVQQLGAEIPQKAATLEEAKTLYPDAVGEVKQAGPFTVKTYDFQQGPFWNVQEVVDKATAVEKGKIAGPVNDFMGGQYLVQVAETVAPDEQAWKDEFPKEKERLRKTLLARRESERFDDYLDYLMLNANVTKNETAVMRALGLDEESQKARAEMEKKQAAEAGGDTAATTPPVDVAPPPAPAEAPAP